MKERIRDRIHVIYEDQDVLIVDKASGVITYPVENEPRGSVIQLIRIYWKYTTQQNQHLYLLHRLDKDTSGLLVFAKTTRARQSLQQQFESHSVLREYLAITHGIPRRKKGEIKTFLGRDFRGRRSVAAKGKGAITHFKVIAENVPANRALVRCRLETGRTHQVRIHMAHIGTPVIGDTVYGKIPSKRLALHADTLGFQHPRTAKPVLFHVSLPADLQELIRPRMNADSADLRGK
jgi:23S rRNA pseudouridine1911/1915/1917 synthase